jgi:hypothetical protein
MQTKSCFSVLAFMLLSFAAFSQHEETLLGDRNWGFSGVWGGYNHQYTQFGGSDAYNRGGFFTFEFGKALNVGWGHNELNERVKLNETEGDLRTRWGFAKVGYGFIPYKAVHPTLNVDFGKGNVRFGDMYDNRIYVVQPSVGVEINVFRWFRLGLEGGYRFVEGSDLAIATDEKLSGAFGQASLKFGFSWGRYHKRQEEKKEIRRED